MTIEWQEKPIQERIEWYEKEMDNLFDYLVNKEPFDNVDVLDTSRELLQRIKDYMDIDRKKPLDPYSSQEEKTYQKAIDEAYSELPDIDSNRDQWFEKLGKAIEVLVKI